MLLKTQLSVQKKQKKYYSGKKKKHSLKTQVVVNKKNKAIICIKYCNGKKHDFRLFKESKIFLKPANLAITDTGYQGIKKIHANSKLLKKDPNTIR